MGPFCLFSVGVCFSLEGSVGLDRGRCGVRGRGHVDPNGGEEGAGRVSWCYGLGHSQRVLVRPWSDTVPGERGWGGRGGRVEYKHV